MKKKPSIQYPGVYVTETSAGTTSVQQVPTDIPGFIGYTEKAENNGQYKPILINSLNDFEKNFGGAPASQYPVAKVDGPAAAYDFAVNGQYYKVQPAVKERFYLYHCLRQYFLNGGKKALIVSAGTYQTNHKSNQVSYDQLLKGLQQLEDDQLQPRPTLLVIPDAMALEASDCYQLQQKMIAQASDKSDRFAILDIWNGWQAMDQSSVITDFRDNIGTSGLKYAAAYYPWLHSKVVKDKEITTASIYQPSQEEMNTHDWVAPGDMPKTFFVEGLPHVLRQANLLPPSAAVAGVYCKVDRERGVWKAPANVNITGVESPAVTINDQQQEPLNVDPVSGKSINAIRSFTGRGPALIWGARTLAGNSNEGRYISVRRFFIMVEQSLHRGTRPFVFEPNDANTWASVKSVVSDFLQELWRAGALQGSSPNHAYGVKVGLGETMTQQDILEGRLIIQVHLAVTHPTEFMVLVIEQRMEGR